MIDMISLRDRYLGFGDGFSEVDKVGGNLFLFVEEFGFAVFVFMGGDRDDVFGGGLHRLEGIFIHEVKDVALVLVSAEFLEKTSGRLGLVCVRLFVASG